MKKTIFNLMRTLSAFTLLAMAISCSGIGDAAETSSEKPVLKITLSNNERTAVPSSDFTTFNFELKSGEKVLGSYNNLVDLEADAIDLTANGINVDDEATFTLSAQKAGVKWTGSTTKTIASGENRIGISLFVTALGTGNGNIDYTLDFSEAYSKAAVSSVHVIVQSATDSSATPILDEWYGIKKDGTEAANKITDYKILVKKENVPNGSYHLSAAVFANEGETGKMVDWGETIVVAAGTTTSYIKSLSSLNMAYSITYDLNYEGSTPIQRKFTGPTTAEALAPKVTRPGYVVRGWYSEPECQNQFSSYTFYYYNYSNTAGTAQGFGGQSKDVTVYANWVEFAPNVKNTSTFSKGTIIFTPENYTVAEFTEDSKSLWYKFNTTPGKQYRIAFINSSNASEYLCDGNVLSSDGFVSSVSCYLYHDEYTKIASSGSYYTFTAEKSETFLNIESYNAGKCAFRISEYDPNDTNNDSMFARVSVLVDDIGLLVFEETYGDKYLYFYLEDYRDYEKTNWYVNGKLVSNATWNSTVSPFKFYHKDYGPGIYTLTLEATKKSNNQLYSFTAQAEVPETN